MVDELRKRALDGLDPSMLEEVVLGKRRYALKGDAVWRLVVVDTIIRLEEEKKITSAGFAWLIGHLQSAEMLAMLMREIEMDDLVIDGRKAVYRPDINISDRNLGEALEAFIGIQYKLKGFEYAYKWSVEVLEFGLQELLDKVDQLIREQKFEEYIKNRYPDYKILDIKSGTKWYYVFMHGETRIASDIYKNKERAYKDLWQKLKEYIRRSAKIPNDKIET